MHLSCCTNSRTAPCQYVGICCAALTRCQSCGISFHSSLVNLLVHLGTTLSLCSSTPSTISEPRNSNVYLLLGQMQYHTATVQVSRLGLGQGCLRNEEGRVFEYGLVRITIVSPTSIEHMLCALIRSQIVALIDCVGNSGELLCCHISFFSMRRLCLSCCVGCKRRISMERLVNVHRTSQLD